MSEVKYSYGAGTESGEPEESSKENKEAVKSAQAEEGVPDKGASQDLKEKPGHPKTEAKTL